MAFSITFALASCSQHCWTVCIHVVYTHSPTLSSSSLNPKTSSRKLGTIFFISRFPPFTGDLCEIEFWANAGGNKSWWYNLLLEAFHCSSIKNSFEFYMPGWITKPHKRQERASNRQRTLDFVDLGYFSVCDGNQKRMRFASQADTHL